jgi:hypothetical protein
VHLRNTPLAKDVDLHSLASSTPGYTGRCAGLAETGNLDVSMIFWPYSVVGVTETAFKMSFLLENGVVQSFLANSSYFFAFSTLRNTFLEAFCRFYLPYIQEGLMQ